MPRFIAARRREKAPSPAAVGGGPASEVGLAIVGGGSGKERDDLVYRYQSPHPTATMSSAGIRL
jgi:hypothetical protein